MSKYSPDNYGDDLFDDIEKERKALQSKRDDNNIKLEKEGDVWLIRFLPALLGIGERKKFYARIAQHWVNKRPHFCARMTPPEFGGHPDSNCPLCDLSTEIADSHRNRNRDVSMVGYRAQASSQWLTYALVWSKESKGQDAIVPEGDDRWQPYRFWLNKTNFEDMLEYWKRYRDKLILAKNPASRLSIFDPDIGTDFFVKRTNNKITLQKDESRSIFDADYTDDDKAALMEYIHSKIKMPTYNPLGSEEMNAACEKLEEAARKTESNPAPRKARSYDGVEDAPRASSRPPARPSAPPPRVPSRPPSRDSVDDIEDQDAPPPRASRPPARPSAPPARATLPSSPLRSVPSARPTQRPSVDEDVVGQVGGDEGTDTSEDDVPFDFEKPKALAETPSSRLKQAARQAQEKSAERSSPSTSSVDDDDDVTDEMRDPVPSSSPDIDDAPPAPVQKVQAQKAPVSRMSDKLRSAISRTQQ